MGMQASRAMVSKEMAYANYVRFAKHLAIVIERAEEVDSPVWAQQAQSVVTVNEPKRGVNNNVQNVTTVAPVSEIMDATKNDQLNIKVSHFLKLLQASAGDVNAPPVNYFISNETIEGEAKQDAAHMKCTLEVTLLKDKWTNVPLFPDTVALLSHKIQYSTSENRKVVEDKTHDDSANPASFCIGVTGRCYSLITGLAGNYTITMDVLVPYASTRKTGFYMDIPKAATNQITFKVPGKDVLIKVDPALFTRSYEVEEKTDDLKVITKSVVTSRFPPTFRLSVQWTENMGINMKAEEQKVEVQATVDQTNLVSIGEGILQIRSHFLYTVISGQISLFEVEIHKDVKVLNVEGLKDFPVKRWDVISDKKETKTLKVWCDYGMEDLYEFTVYSEVPMKGTSAKVEIPAFNCLVNKDIQKDKGFLAVEARTNVEVEEIGCSAMAPIDISELPQTIFKMTSNPILFAYKFITPTYKLSLDVRKHADLSVLVAVIDAAYFTATYSEEGSTLYKLLLIVRNTQRQYVRIAVTGEFEVWSTVVAGNAVKPAKDDKGNMMIPLRKTSKTDNESDSSFQVEFIYLKKVMPLVQKGEITVSFPQLDLPITQQFVKLYLPKDYKYKEFKGMREVSYFSRGEPASQEPVKNYVRGGEAKNEDINVFLQEQGEMLDIAYDRISYSKQIGGKRGVKPVKVEVPTAGKQFLFEQQLPTGKEIVVTTTYSATTKGRCSQRRIGFC